MSKDGIDSTSTRRRPWLMRQWHYAVVVLLTVLFYFPLVLPGMGLPAGGDFFAFHTPYRIYTSMKLHQGVLPLYAHEMFGGYPIFQDPQFALLYPVNLLFGLAVPDAGSQGALDAYVLINLVLLSVAALFFMRSFRLGRFAAVVAAAVACFNGFIVVHVTHINMVQVLSTSLVAAGLIARYARGGARDVKLPLGAAVALACGNLAGHPQTTMYTHYALVAGAVALAVDLLRHSGSWQLAMRLLVATAMAVVAGVLLAAVQLIPTAELLRISTRASVSRAEVMWSGLEVVKLPSVIFPGFYMRLPWSFDWPPYFHTVEPNHPQAWFAWLSENFSEVYAAMGLGALLLGMVGWFVHWRNWMVQVLGWGCVFLLGCATGENLPFYGWLYDVVPGFKLVRVSTRILLVFFPAWGLLVGLGLESLLKAELVRARRAAAAAFYLVAAAGAAWLIWALSAHEGDWLDTWIRAFAGEGGYIGRVMLERRGVEYLAALKDQLLLGGAITAALALIFFLPRMRPKLRVGLLAAVVGLEIVIYCFGWATAINYPGITTTQAPEMASVPQETPGRVLNFTAPNMGLHMGRMVANGYSVTLDDWVTAFQPDAVPPFREGMQETLLDLWNVQDIVTKRTPREALVRGEMIAVDDWGWREIGAPWVAESGETSVTTRALMPVRLTVDFETTQPVKALHLVATSGRSWNFPDGTQIASVLAKGENGEALTSAAVVLGENVSESRFPLVDQPDHMPLHSRVPLSYYRIIPNHWSSGVSFYDTSLDIATSEPLRTVTLETTGPYSTTLGVNAIVAVLADDSIVARDLYGVAGFEEVESLTPDHRVLHRDEVPGYARMVATAVAGSYKRTDNIMWRMFNGETDPRETVIVDKRKLNDEQLRRVNAPHPQEFSGSAEVEWLSDRHGRVKASANMQGWVFLSQTWDAGWRAEVDGEAVEIFRANGPFMAIPVKGGEQEIHLRYRPEGLVAGGLISGFTAAGMVAMLLVAARRKRRNVTAEAAPI